MKTLLTTAIALVIAAPAFAGAYDLGDKPLTTSQRVLVESILDSDENTNTKQRRIDVIVGNTRTYGSRATRNRALLNFFQSSDKSTDDIDRRVGAAVN